MGHFIKHVAGSLKLTHFNVPRKKGVVGVGVFDGQVMEGFLGALEGVGCGVDVNEAIGKERVEIERCLDEEGVKELCIGEVFGCYPSF